jgi:NADH-quinone oxidoreductase subunit L
MDARFPWFILLAPLVSAVLIQLFTRKSRSLSATLSVAAVCFCLLGSLFLAMGGNVTSQVSWLDFPSVLRVPIGVTVDALSKVMLLVVTGVGTLVHVYSLVYMREDESEARFFGNLSFFMFSMLGIVLADNFVMMFIFWELVGVSSWLLIGHWYGRDSAAKAANKAFLSNRIGDFGFMLGILMIWTATGTVVFSEMQAAIEMHTLSLTAGFLTLSSLLIFCGAVGKSAQVPLHVWLPDAMEGPTPVSALIHAATMVAAGVYMLARVSFYIGASDTALTVISWVGIITAVLAALMATQQDDIKRILAYSTLSQLGYMISAIGLAAPDAAMFHLFTHAFFKALLFLGAGAIIHALHHEQDIWRMGGLSTKMKLTFVTFSAGYLALIGCPFFSGFFSKDLILLAAWQQSPAIFILGLLTAVLTAFYMTRLMVVVFLGEARTEEARHVHDGPIAMTGPLVILGFLSVVAGYGIFANPAIGEEAAHSLHRIHERGGAALVTVLATIAFIIGTGAGWVLYRGQSKDPILIPLFRNKFYFDELYAALIAGTQDLLASISRFIDTWFIDGVLVRGLSGAAWATGFTMRLLQLGNLQGYALIFGFGVIAMIYLLVFR